MLLDRQIGARLPNRYPQNPFVLSSTIIQFVLLFCAEPDSKMNQIAMFVLDTIRKCNRVHLLFCARANTLTNCNALRVSESKWKQMLTVVLSPSHRCWGSICFGVILDSTCFWSFSHLPHTICYGPVSLAALRHPPV